MQTNKSKIPGLTGTLLFSCLLLFIFYGKLLFALNTTFFSTEGDGIQCYFNSTYLVKYDSSLLYSHSMNYPNGDLSFYTQSQPLLLAPVKFISRQCTDITPYTVGIINFMMLFSIILASLFLYLIFNELKLPVLPSILIGTGIAFLSPQIGRMGGHYTLAYVWAIPALVYLLMLFHKYQRSIYSVLIGISLIILISGHVYFAAFYFILIGCYWLFMIFKNYPAPFKGYMVMFWQFLLQFLFPVLLFYFITDIYNHLVPERPSKPYGFLVFVASLESIFLPVGLDYGRFLHHFRDFSAMQWEGEAYVGFVSLIGSVFLAGRMFFKMFRKKWEQVWTITDNDFLNVMFWASILSLLYSFSVPFCFKLHFLVDYMGPLQQLRALGRFSWPFYYMINIVVFYLLWKTLSGKRGRIVLLWMAIALLLGDVVFYSKIQQPRLYHQYPEWSDAKNILLENHWVEQIQADKYQAIIPMPFYHMGSDNFGIDVRCNALANSFLVSAKTGLPIMAIYMSRASVPQSANNIAIALEPVNYFQVLNDLPSKKDFLLVVSNCNQINSQECFLVKSGIKIDSNTAFSLFRLPWDSLRLLPEKACSIIKREVASKAIDRKDTLYSFPADAEVIRYDYHTEKESMGYRGHALVIDGRSGYTLHDAPVTMCDESYTVSFWIHPVNKDLIPKTRLNIELFTTEGSEFNRMNVMCGHYIKAIDGNWGLVEFTFPVNANQHRIKISVYNGQINKKQKVQLDEFILKPESCDVYLRTGIFLMKNNLWYNTINH
jgi:hypothetical protein